MAGAKLEKTRYPGIYRRGSRWVYAWTDSTGHARRGTADTREEASRLKAEEEQRAKAGAPAEATARRLTVAGYALDLFGADPGREAGVKPRMGRYQGRRGAIRENTRKDYRAHMERTWLPLLGHRQLANVATPELARAVAMLTARDGDEYLADASIRRMFVPLAAMFSQAAEEGLLIASNPAISVRLPSGRDELKRFDTDSGDDGDDPEPGRARSLTREQLSDVLLVVDGRWRLLVEVLASTGLRISEALALRWRDLRLDGDRPVIQVRRAYVDGAFGPPKSRHGRRDVPITFEVVRALRERRKNSEWGGDDDLAWPSTAGTPMEARNLRRRTLAPAAEEAGVPWAGFHAFRHTCASMLIADGRNIVQVSRWLGHHSPSFTLSVYAHLLDDGVGAPLELGGVTSGSRSVSRDAVSGMGPGFEK